MVRDDFMGNAAGSEDETQVFNAKRLKGRKREIRKSTLRRRKTPTMKAHHKFSLSLLQPLRGSGCWRQGRQEFGSQMLTSGTLLLKSP